MNTFCVFDLFHSQSIGGTLAWMWFNCDSTTKSTLFCGSKIALFVELLLTLRN